MQIFATTLIGKQVFIFQANEIAGKVSKLLVNTSNLNIDLIEVELSNKNKSYIRTADIKSYADSIVIIESINDLSEANDLIRYQELIRSKFKIIGAKIKTQDGKKIGIVKDFTIDRATFKTLKIHANASLIKRIFNESLIIDIKDVVKVSDKTIIVKSTKLKSKQKYTKALPARSG